MAIVPVLILFNEASINAFLDLALDFFNLFLWSGIGTTPLKPVRTPVAIFGSLGVCIYVPASRHWLISYSPIHLN